MQPMLNKLFFIVILLSIAVLLYFLAPILTPFLVAALLAYLADPLVEKMTKYHLPRLLCVITVFLLLFITISLGIIFLIPLVQKQILMLTIVIPNMIEWLQNTILPSLQNYFGIEETINVQTLKNILTTHWTMAGGAAAWLLKAILHSSMTLLMWMTNLILIPVVTFYMLRDWNGILQGIRDLIPRKNEETIVQLVQECDMVLGAFFRGQLLVMISLSIVYALGLVTVGLHVGLIIGLIAGLLSIVPYLGSIVGIVVASIAMFVQAGNFMPVLLVWVVFVIGHLLENIVLTPYLIGDRIGLHPVLVILAVLMGGSLFGFFGVLLALPVAAITLVWLRFFNQHYRQSQLYKT